MWLKDVFCLKTWSLPIPQQSSLLIHPSTSAYPVQEYDGVLGAIPVAREQEAVYTLDRSPPGSNEIVLMINLYQDKT